MAPSPIKDQRAMATVAARIHTPDDLLKMPDANNIELVNGELVENPVSALSSFVEGNIFAKISSHCAATKTHLAFPSSNGIRCFPDDPNKVRKPDVSVFEKERFTLEHMLEGFVTIAPNLAVEVVSTNDEVAELNEKIEDYLAAGVPLIWVIDPANEIAFIHRKDGSVTKLHRNDALTGENILPGFTCKVAELFPDVSTV
jgi:Uma2 family endonuclease